MDSEDEIDEYDRNEMDIDDIIASDNLLNISHSGLDFDKLLDHPDLELNER